MLLFSLRGYKDAHITHGYNSFTLSDCYILSLLPSCLHMFLQPCQHYYVLQLLFSTTFSCCLCFCWIEGKGVCWVHICAGEGSEHSKEWNDRHVAFWKGRGRGFYGEIPRLSVGEWSWHHQLNKGVIPLTVVSTPFHWRRALVVPPDPAWSLCCFPPLESSIRRLPAAASPTKPCLPGPVPTSADWRIGR